jgi:2-dehydropantoate 2-reductase
MHSPTPPQPALRVAVIGAGAVGAVLGARLVQAGADVTFVARGATLDALRTRGLVIEHPQGDVRLPPGRAAAAAAEVGPVDVVLVAVKAAQVPEVAPTLAPLLGRARRGAAAERPGGERAAGRGAGPRARRRGAVPDARRAGGAGAVRHAGDVPGVIFGARGARAPHGGPLAPGARDALARLADAFRRADVAVDTPDDAEPALWEKALFVEPLGVVGAAARAGFGELLGDPETRAALAACGARSWPWRGRAASRSTTTAPARAWARYETLPAGGTTSMQRDLVAGRPSELEAQTGALVRLGRAHGAATPVHDVLYAVLRPQEARARSTPRLSPPPHARPRRRPHPRPSPTSAPAPRGCARRCRCSGSRTTSRTSCRRCSTVARSRAGARSWWAATGAS